MLRLTRTAVGLLTAQYRSVLKKCWAINVGIFALGAVAATAIPTEAMAAIDASTLNNATVNTGTGTINWTYQGTSEPSGYTWYETSTSYPSGTQYVVGTAPNGSFALRVIDGGTTKYFTGTYTKPSNYGALARNTAFTNADAPNGGYYYDQGATSSTSNQGGAITITGYKTITNPIIADFIKNGFNPGTTTATSQSGGAIYNYNGTIKNLTGNFIGNSSSNYDGGAIYSSGGTITNLTGNFIDNKSSNRGGAIFLDGTISNLTGSFIGNYAPSVGGAIYIYSGKITNLTGNFIGNKARDGGAIDNHGTISSLTGNFIGNRAYSSIGTMGTGGAIWNSGAITFVGDSYFADNIDKNGPNDIDNYMGTINIGKDSSNTANVTLNSGYKGSSSTKLVINSGSTFTINEHNNGSGVRASILGNVTNEGTFNIGVDINATGVDTFSLSSYTSTGKKGIIITAINELATPNPNKSGGYAILTGSGLNTVENPTTSTANGAYLTLGGTYTKATLSNYSAWQEIGGNTISWTDSWVGRRRTATATQGYFLNSIGTVLGYSTGGTVVDQVIVSTQPLNWLVTKESNEEKYFTAANAGDPYSLTYNPGTLTGNLTIDGKSSTSSKFNAGSYYITLGSGSVLTLKDVIAYATSYGNNNNGVVNGTDGTLKLNNATLFQTQGTGYTKTFGAITGVGTTANNKIVLNATTTNGGHPSNTTSYDGIYTFTAPVENVTLSAYNGGTVNLNSSVTNSAVNAYQTATVNLSGMSNSAITLNDTSTLNLSGSSTGAITLNNSSKLNLSGTQSGAINMYDTSVIAPSANITGSLNNYSTGTLLDLRNGGVGTTSITTLNLGNYNLNVALDVNVNDNAADSITGSKNGSGKLIISDLSSQNLPDAGSADVDSLIKIFDNSNLSYIEKTVNVYSPSLYSNGTYSFADDIDSRVGGTHSNIAGTYTFHVHKNPVYTKASQTGTTGDIVYKAYDALPSGYEGIDSSDTAPAVSTIVYTPNDGTTPLNSVKGVVKVNTPNGVKYIEYSTVPKGDALTRDTSLTNDEAPNGGYYYNRGLTYSTNAEGGAISIKNGTTITNPIIADFIKNGFNPNNTTVTAQYGGAIYIYGTSSNRPSVDTIKGNFIGNSATRDGGAIYKYFGNITNLTGDFIGNNASSSGGAIYNYYSYITNLTGNFIGNNANYGGAIYNTGGTINTLTGDFIGNNASSSGGAIYHTTSIISNLTGNFIGNNASDRGGAIYSSGNYYITFVGDSYFAGNMAKNSPNDIYNYSGTINIGNTDGTTANVTLNSGYAGERSNNAKLVINSGSTLTINEHNNGSGVRESNLGVVTNNGTFNIGVDINATGVDTFNFYRYTSTSPKKGIIITAINELATPDPNKNGGYAILTGGSFNTKDISSSTSNANGTYLILADSLKPQKTSDATDWTAPTIDGTAVTWNELKETRLSAGYSAGYDYYNTTHTAIKYIEAVVAQQEKQNYTGGDMLAYINQYVASNGTEKKYTAASASDSITSSATPGTTSGKLTLTGVINGDTRSQLNLNSKTGFVLDSYDDLLKFDSLRVYGGNSYTAYLNHSDAQLNIVNSIIDGTQIYGSGKVDLSGTNTINVPVVNTGGITVSDGTTYFNSTVNGFTNSDTVYVDADNITGAVTNGGTVNLTTGTLSQNITGSGTTSIAENNTVTNNATISNEVSNAGTLNSSASNLGNTVNNTNTLNLTTGTLSNNITGSGTTNIVGGNTVTNNATISNEVNNSGTLITAANALTGSSVTNTGTLELEGGSLRTSLLGNGRMKLMSGNMKLSGTANTGKLSFGDSDDYVDSILISSSDSSTSNYAIVTGGYLNNNYYRKNKKSGILNGFEEGEIGNEIGDFSQLVANDNFATTTFLRAI